MRGYVLSPGYAASSQIDAALEIPGCKHNALTNQLVIPENALPPVAKFIHIKAEFATFWGWGTSFPDWYSRKLRDWVPSFLTEYQKEGIKEAIRVENLILWHPPGAGKTLSAIVWALIRQGPTVVVTKAAVRRQWRNEIERYTTATTLLIEGEQPFTFNGEDFVVIGWENLPAHISALKSIKPTSVVFDELHKGKSQKRFKTYIDVNGERSYTSLANVANAAKKLSMVAKRRLGTTATPIKNRLKDLWAQLDLIQPGQWGSYWQWAFRYCNVTKNQFGGLDANGKSNEEELKTRLAYIMHQVPFEVTHRQLPPKRRIVTRVRTGDQNAASGGFKSLFKKANGYISTTELRLQEAASKKKKYIVEIVKEAIEAKQKVCIFTGRREDVRRLWEEVSKVFGGLCEHIFATSGEDASYEANGNDGPRELKRAAYMEADGPAVFIATGDSIGEGLNLHDTDLAIFAMLPYTPGQLIQWEGRFSRLGQKRPVLIQYLVADGTIDERVSSILLDKIEHLISNDVLGGLSEELIGDKVALSREAMSLILSGE